MNLTLVPRTGARATDLAVFFLFDEDLSAKSAALAPLGELAAIVRKAATEEGFSAKADQTFVLHTHGRGDAGRVLLVGLGAKKKFRNEALRLAAGKVAKLAGKLRTPGAALYLPDGEALPERVRATVEGLLLGDYRFFRYRTTHAEEQKAPRLSKVQLVLPEGAAKDRALADAVTLGTQIAEATNWARDLVNEPAGVVHPSRLADEARAMAKEVGLEVRVLGRKEIEKLRMGMFLGVAQGSAHEPKLVELRYVPKSPKHAKQPPVSFVGKAITFDSGGLSLKTADGMVDMKSDMAGSAAVLGAMRVVGELKPPFPVNAYFGACENMPSGTSYRPGDVLISRLGKTVEITNTDAEGRLVLGDVLAYACEQKPAALIDLATLTGACMVALGHYVTGAFGDDEALMNEVLGAGKDAGEELWQLPIHEMQKDALKSDIADMKNSGERYGAAINAAVFLREFVGETPWVHLDIAGPSLSPKERGYLGKGATGVGVRTLVEFVRQRAAKA